MTTVLRWNVLPTKVHGVMPADRNINTQGCKNLISYVYKRLSKTPGVRKKKHWSTILRICVVKSHILPSIIMKNIQYDSPKFSICIVYYYIKNRSKSNTKYRQVIFVEMFT
jgi:hypothetical protein